MRKQVSGDENDLRTTYVLFSLIPIAIGTLLLFFDGASNYPILRQSNYEYFATGSVAIGILFMVMSLMYVPYCYRVEVDSDKIFVTKSKTIITTQLEKTIAVNKSELAHVTKSLVGFSIGNTTYVVRYLHFKCETEFGSKIAFLTRLRSVNNDRYFD